jgi:hypothetical protein
MLYTYVVSRVDGRTYKVRNNRLAQESADLLSHINARIVLLRTKILSLPQSELPEYAERLSRFSPESISENLLNMDTTYTINKGESIYFCVGPRHHDEHLYDINTMMYVALHELAHIVSVSVGHGDEFQKNFKDLLRHAIQFGIYEYVDYSKNPQEYCGITISRSILS